MEFPTIGARCNKEHCQQLNFLPHVCPCGGTFCEEHFTQHSLDCQITDNVVTDLKQIEDIYVCSEVNCNDRSIVELLCQKCGKHFCIKHRHIGECVPKTEEDYVRAREELRAPLDKFNAVKENIDKEISKNLEEAKRNEKKRKMACKIQLMRLKNKAIGQKSIPTADRAYFNVILPSKTEKALFISKTWTVGRTIDSIAELCQLQNNNNRSGELKLRLFKMDKTILTKIMSVYVNDLLLKEDIIEGENLIIQYVKDECSVLN